MEKTNIHQIIATMDIGGVERQLIELVKGLDKNKYNVTICCITRGGPLEEDLKKLGIEYHILYKKFKFDFTVIFRLIRLIRQKKIDLIHTYLFTANTWGRIAAVLAGVPIVIASGRNAIPWRKKMFHILIDRFLSRYTDIIICNSSFIKKLNTKRNQ